MLNAEQCFLDCINSPVRNVRARVELYNGSTLISTFKYTDRLKSFTVERVGEGKFFGFGICQRLNVKIIDKDRELSITTANTFNVAFGTNNSYIYPFPVFKVSEVHRDEATNELSITAYDVIYQATNHTVAELGLIPPYTIKGVAEACASLLGVSLGVINIPEEDNVFNTEYAEGANFEGTDNIREALNDIAEATQTIYYIDNNQQLIFKRLDITGNPVATIDKSKYFTFSSSDNRRLSAICHATELGDNVIAQLEISGSTQYVRDNAFWELRDNIQTIVNNALAAVGNLTINQFICQWRGNYLIEIGDKIGLITKDNETVYSYLLNDTISYDGSFNQATQWNFDIDGAETDTNPATLGDALRQTYARVDKVNKQINLVVSNNETLTNRIEDTQEQIDNANIQITQITNKVNAQLTANDVRIEIEKVVQEQGEINSITTATGYVFNESGLNISKADSEINTIISEDGMKIVKDTDTVLTANNTGVDAKNLHATTYLIVGVNSRFEDYDNNSRTGCFWIGD